MASNFAEMRDARLESDPEFKEMYEFICDKLTGALEKRQQKQQECLDILIEIEDFFLEPTSLKYLAYTIYFSIIRLKDMQKEMLDGARGRLNTHTKKEVRTILRMLTTMFQKGDELQINDCLAEIAKIHYDSDIETCIVFWFAITSVAARPELATCGVLEAKEWQEWLVKAKTILTPLKP
jgi:hypothetical protein